MRQSSSTISDHGQNFDIGELINKLANSPRKADGSPKRNENSEMNSTLPLFFVAIMKVLIFILK